MRRFFSWAIVAVVIAGVLGVAEFNRHHPPQRAAGGSYRTAVVRNADIAQIVTLTGTVQPVLSVQVGSYASGPVHKVCVDFNAVVKKDQVLAEIDPLIYKAQRNQASAALLHAKADLEQYKAKLTQMQAEWRRVRLLRPDKVAAAEAAPARRLHRRRKPHCRCRPSWSTPRWPIPITTWPRRTMKRRRPTRKWPRR